MEIENHSIVVYNSSDGHLQLDVKLDNETVWLTQAQMATLFDKNQSVIARHIQNAFKEEVEKESNMQILHNTLSKYRPTTFRLRRGWRGMLRRLPTLATGCRPALGR